MEIGDRYMQAGSAKYDCLLFDLDDTLYPLSTGIAEACTKNIQDYMVERLGIDRGKISKLGDLLYRNYGTTLSGLRAIGYDFEYDDYHGFVHGRLPYENIKPDPVLRNILLSLPFRKIIFTNSDKVHAAKALKRLGLEDCFEGIICFETLNPSQQNYISDSEDDIEFTGSRYSNGSPEIFDIVSHFSQPNTNKELPKTPVVCKPSENAIDKALKIANLDPKRTMFFDDSVRNIQAGKRIGLQTVLVGKSQRVKGADFALENMHNLRDAIPELWETDVKPEVSCATKVAVETPVRA